jgi:hypothetical protein
LHSSNRRPKPIEIWQFCKGISWKLLNVLALFGGRGLEVRVAHTSFALTLALERERGYLQSNSRRLHRCSTDY